MQCGRDQTPGQRKLSQHARSEHRMKPHFSQLGGVELSGLQEDFARDPELPHVVEEGPGADLLHRGRRELEAVCEQVREEGDAVAVIEERWVLSSEAFRHAGQFHGSRWTLRSFEGHESEIELAGDLFHGTSWFVPQMSKLRAEVVCNRPLCPKRYELLQESPRFEGLWGALRGCPCTPVYARVRRAARQRTDSPCVGDVDTWAG